MGEFYFDPLDIEILFVQNCSLRLNWMVKPCQKTCVFVIVLFSLVSI